MLAIARQRLQKDDEDGFTLIELMVVVLIIAILLAIAIPTFLGAQDRARDRAAQSDLRNVVAAAKTIATDTEGLFYVAPVAPSTDPGGVTLTLLQEAEANIEMLADSGGTTSIVGVKVATAATEPIYVYKGSASGDWFGMATSPTGEVGFCTADNKAAITDAVPSVTAAGALTICNGADFNAPLAAAPSA